MSAVEPSYQSAGRAVQQLDDIHGAITRTKLDERSRFELRFKRYNE
jgi:hypothetical protein